MRDRRSEGSPRLEGAGPSPQDPTACLSRPQLPRPFHSALQRLYLEVGDAPGLLVNVPPLSKPSAERMSTKMALDAGPNRDKRLEAP